ncbi:MAG: hypothetical protein ACRDHZ_24125, partial [Ktedonobacteraceae bacterium]
MLISLGKQLRKLASLPIAAALIGTAICQQGSAQINFGGLIFMGTTETITPNGSPTLTYMQVNGKLYLYYVNRDNSTIYVDVGLTGQPISTGIVVYSGGVTDVGADANFGSTGDTILLTYIAPNQVPMAAVLATNGYSIISNVSINTSSTGFNSNFVPTPAPYGSSAWGEVAVVGNGNYVYLYATLDNGQTFGYLHQISSIPTISRPAISQDGVYFGWTNNTSGGRNAVFGRDGSMSYIPGYFCGQNNRNGAYAGVGLVNYAGGVYVFSQNVLNAQQAQYVFTLNGGASWSGLYQPGNAMRWNPALAFNGGAVFFLYLDQD